MQEITYSLQNTLTGAEQLIMLRFLDTVDELLQNKLWHSVLSNAAKDIIFGQVTRKDLVAMRSCLIMCRNMNDDLPAKKQNHTLNARITKILTKLQALCDSPAA